MDDEYGSFVSSDDDNQSIQIQQNLNPNRIAGVLDDDASSMRTSSESESFLLSGSFVKANEQGRYSDNLSKKDKGDSPTKSKFFKKTNQSVVNSNETNSLMRFSEGSNEEGKNKFNEIEEMVESIRKSQRISATIHETNEEDEQHNEEKQQVEQASDQKNENHVNENELNQQTNENFQINKNSDNRENNKKEDHEVKENNDNNNHEIQDPSNENKKPKISEINEIQKENKENQNGKNEEKLLDTNEEIKNTLNTEEEEKQKDKFENRIEPLNEQIKTYENGNSSNQNIELPVDNKNFENDIHKKEENIKNEEILQNELNVNVEMASEKQEEQLNKDELFPKNEQNIKQDQKHLKNPYQISENENNALKEIDDPKNVIEHNESNVSPNNEEIIIFETNEKDKKADHLIPNENDRSNEKISMEEGKDSSNNFLNEEMKKTNSQAQIQNFASSSTMESHLKSIKKERHCESNDEFFHFSSKKYSLEEIKLSDDIQKTNQKSATKENEVITSSLDLRHYGECIPAKKNEIKQKNNENIPEEKYPCKMCSICKIM